MPVIKVPRVVFVRITTKWSYGATSDWAAYNNWKLEDIKEKIDEENNWSDQYRGCEVKEEVPPLSVIEGLLKETRAHADSVVQWANMLEKAYLSEHARRYCKGHDTNCNCDGSCKK